MTLDVLSLEVFYKSDNLNDYMRRKVLLGANSTKFLEFVSESQTRTFFGDELGPSFIGDQWFNGINNKKDPTLKEVIDNLEIMMDKI